MATLFLDLGLVHGWVGMLCVYIDSNPIIKNPITTSSCLRLLPIIPSHGNEYLAKRSITLMLIDIIFVNEKILWGLMVIIAASFMQLCVISEFPWISADSTELRARDVGRHRLSKLPCVEGRLWAGTQQEYARTGHCHGCSTRLENICWPAEERCCGLRAVCPPHRSAQTADALGEERTPRGSCAEDHLQLRRRLDPTSPFRASSLLPTYFDFAVVWLLCLLFLVFVKILMQEDKSKSVADEP